LLVDCYGNNPIKSEEGVSIAKNILIFVQVS